MASPRKHMCSSPAVVKWRCWPLDNLVIVFLLVLWTSTCKGQVCPAYFPRDHLNAPLSLPTAIQLEPTSTPHWQSYWQVLKEDGQPLACLLMEGNETNTIIQSAATSCHNVTQWDNTVTWPSFVRGGEAWYNLYTMYLFASDDRITAQLNQQKGDGLTQDTKTPATAMNRMNMTNGGPQMKLPRLQAVDSCLALTGCEQGWSDLSLAPSDTIFLLPEFSEQIEVRVTLSSCFQEYNIGVYNTSASRGDILRLVVSYSRGDRYHTLAAELNLKAILSVTVDHRGLDCRGDWYLVGVKGAIVTPNCTPKNNTQTSVSPYTRSHVITTGLKEDTQAQAVHSSPSFSATSTLIPQVIIISLVIVGNFR